LVRLLKKGEKVV